MVEERSSDRSPRVSVTFPDGYQDNLVLSRFDANDEDRMANKEHCNFIGHLENEPEACVAMTGCSGSEDVHLTIISKHVMISAPIIILLLEKIFCLSLDSGGYSHNFKMA